jgi:hypothetical protein
VVLVSTKGSEHPELPSPRPRLCCELPQTYRPRVGPLPINHSPGFTEAAYVRGRAGATKAIYRDDLDDSCERAAPLTQAYQKDTEHRRRVAVVADGRNRRREVRAAVMLAGKELRKLNFGLADSPRLPCFGASCGRPVPSREKRESPRGSGWN